MDEIMNKHAPHLLLPTDLTVDIKDLLQQVLRLRPPPRSRLTILHVRGAPGMRDERMYLNAFRHLPNMLTLPQDAETRPGGDPRDIRSEIEPANDRMSPPADPVGSSCLFVQAVWRYGDVVQEVLAYANEAHVDAILMYAKPHIGWRRWRRSISGEIMRHAPCQTVLLPAVEGESFGAVFHARGRTSHS
jgi:nucleotide-binding universal stress UspA family protein